MPANNFSVAAEPKRLIGTAIGIANTPLVCTAAAPGAGFKFVVCGVDYSSTGTIAAGVAPSLTRTHSATQTSTWGMPAAQVMPFGVGFGETGLDTDENTPVVATLPALGAGVVGYVNIWGKKIAVR